MQRIFSLFFFLALFSPFAKASLEADLVKSYTIWQKAMVTKDFRAWDAIMSSDRKREVRNLIYSQKFNYPQEIFNIPFSPPAIEDLKLLKSEASGANAKAVFFGKVDFGVGGKPTENLLVVSYKNQANYWRFVGAEYVNLSGLPEVRTEIAQKNYNYLNQEVFKPAAYIPENTVALKGPVPIIAKVYAYCPGREVRTKVNGISNHLFQNTKEAEVVIGGAKADFNEIQVAIKGLPGGEGTEPLCVRVYLFSQVEGVLPIKALEYLVAEGAPVKPIQTLRFEVTQEMIKTLIGKK